MQTVIKKTYSGAVSEFEQYTLPDTVINIKGSSPPEKKAPTPEEKKAHNDRQSLRRFIKSVNTNCNLLWWYVTLSHDDDTLPATYEEAIKARNRYIRRLQRLYKNVKIFAVTGYGTNSGRLHHHLIIYGVPKADIISKWTGGTVYRTSKLREHNYYGMVDYGQDYTGLAEYLHAHTPESFKGKRWFQTKNLDKPDAQPAKKTRTIYNEHKPPKPPKGYMLVETYRCGYYASSYIRFKYVRIPPPEEADADMPHLFKRE